jgi:septal ring factor EnvC (AmiA/AmiB activator)
MELTSSALTAALVGVIVVLTKVIEWLMKRSANGNGKTKQAKDYNGLGEVLVKIDTKLDMLSTGLSEMRQGRAQLLEHMANADSSHERIVERLGDVASGLNRLADSVADLKERKNR